MTRFGLPLLMLLGTLLPACGSYQSPGEKLQISVIRYNDSLRWGRFQTAGEYIPTDKREAFLERQRAQSEHTRILEYELREVRHPSGAEKAEVILRFRWLESPSNIVQTDYISQDWRYTDEKRWELVGAKILKKKAAPSPTPFL